MKILIGLIMFFAMSAVVLITVLLKIWLGNEASKTGQSADDYADTTDEGEAKAARRRVRTLVDYGHYPYLTG